MSAEATRAGKGAGAGKFPWVPATLGAAALVFGGGFLVSIPVAPEPTGFEAQPPGEVLAMARFSESQADARVAEHLELRDPTPLYLPTRWNSGVVQPSMTREASPGTSFEAIEPKLVFGRDEPDVAFPEVLSLPRTAAAAVRNEPVRPAFDELARREISPVMLDERGAFAEVRRADDGRSIFAGPVDMAWPESGLLPPVELLLAVDATGLIGDPVVTESSGDPEVDQQAVEVVGASRGIRAVLRPGIYRILLGP